MINVAVSADRAVLDNQIGVMFEFLRPAPCEACGKTWKKKNAVENERGARVCRGESDFYYKAPWCREDSLTID